MRIRPLDLVDVFVYLVVLGVFVQFFPTVISESFVLSLLTAVLLKVVLECVLWAKKRMLARVRSAKSLQARVTNIGVLVLLLPGSKFVVLELVALVFQGQISAGRDIRPRRASNIP